MKNSKRTAAVFKLLLEFIDGLRLCRGLGLESFSIFGIKIESTLVKDEGQWIIN